MTLTKVVPDMVVPGRNLLHNGDMRINQMGNQTGVGATARGFTACDLFRLDSLGSASARWSSSQGTYTGGVDGNSWWLKTECTTADASPGSTEIAFINQSFEDGDVQRYLRAANGGLKQYVVSFDVILAKGAGSNISFPAKVGIAARATNYNGSVQQQYVADFTVAEAATWERVSVVVPANNTQDLIHNSTGGSTSISFELYGGSGRASSGGAWETSGTDGHIVGTNLADATGNYMGLTNIKVEVGSIATEFESGTAEEELSLAKRFWQSSYDMGVTPGTVTDVGRESRMIVNNASNQNYFRVNYPVQLRVSSTPDVTIYTPSAGTAAKYDNETDTAEIAITLVEADAKGFTIRPTSGTNQNLGDWITFHWTANERN